MLIIIIIICTFFELKKNSFSAERASKRKGRMVEERTRQEQMGERYFDALILSCLGLKTKLI